MKTTLFVLLIVFCLAGNAISQTGQPLEGMQYLPGAKVQITGGVLSPATCAEENSYFDQSPMPGEWKSILELADLSGIGQCISNNEWCGYSTEEGGCIYPIVYSKGKVMGSLHHNAVGNTFQATFGTELEAEAFAEGPCLFWTGVCGSPEVCLLGAYSMSSNEGNLRAPIKTCQPYRVTLTVSAGLCESDYPYSYSSIYSAGIEYSPIQLGGPGSISLDLCPGEHAISLSTVAGVSTDLLQTCPTNQSKSCSDQVSMTLQFEPGTDMDLNGLAECDEEDPGDQIHLNNDDDDQDGIIDRYDNNVAGGDDDLRVLTLTQGVTASTTYRLEVNAGFGNIAVYEDNAKTIPVPLPKIFSSSELPKTLYVEGVGLTTGPPTILRFFGNDPGSWWCSDTIELFVEGLDFICETYYGPNLKSQNIVRLLNTYPKVELDAPSIPSTGNPVTVSIIGTVSSDIGPLTQQNVKINGLPVTNFVLQTNSSGDLGPFVYRFSSDVTLEDFDQLILAEAVDGAGNRGMDKILTEVKYDADPDPDKILVFDPKNPFLSRSFVEEPSTPNDPNSGSGWGQWFQLFAVDHFKEEDEFEVTLQTGVESNKKIKMKRILEGGIIFRSDNYYFCPENLTLPPECPEKVKDSRVRGKLGHPFFASAPLSSGTAHARAITAGSMFVGKQGTTIPSTISIEKIKASLPKDLGNSQGDKEFLIMVGAPGDAFSTTPGGNGQVEVTLKATDFRDKANDPPIYEEKSAFLKRQSNNPGDPLFNLFLKDPNKPFIAIGGETTTGFGFGYSFGSSIPVSVLPGGFLEMEEAGFPFFIDSAKEIVRGSVAVNILIDGFGAGFPSASHNPGSAENFETLFNAGLLPHFQKILPNFSQSFRLGTTTFPSITFSAWSSWATGRDPNKHGVTGSNFFVRDITADPLNNPSHLLFPLSNPHAHFSFNGTWPFVDFDIAEVWDLPYGSLDLATRTATLYEAAKTSGLKSSVVMHFNHRGASNNYLPNIAEASVDTLIDFISSTHYLLGEGYLGAVKLDARSLELLRESFAKLPEYAPPDILTLYFPGLDHWVHHDSLYPILYLGGLWPAGVQFLVDITDKCLASLIANLELCNLWDGAVFTMTGDHGLTDCIDSPINSIMIEDLKAVFDMCGTSYELMDEGMLASAFPSSSSLDDFLQDASQSNFLDILFSFGWETEDYSAVVGLNGGMAHIYVKNQATPSATWKNFPNFNHDVYPIATRLYKNSFNLLQILDNPSLLGAIEMVLVRDAAAAESWNADYKVLHRDASGIYVYLTLEEALASGLVPADYVDFVANIRRLQDIRSGDIILLASPNFYFGSELEAWHGSLRDTDMTIPFITSFPTGEGEELQEFLDVWPKQNPRITDFAPSIYKYLTGKEFPGQNSVIRSPHITPGPSSSTPSIAVPPMGGGGGTGGTGGTGGSSGGGSTSDGQ